MEEARKFANNSMHEGKDCCIVVVLSHGGYDELAGVDCSPIVRNFEEIVNEELKEAYLRLTANEYCREFEKFVKAEETYNPLAYGRVNIHDFLDCFKSEGGKATDLADKPKLFFFQACRGSECQSLNF